MRSKARLTAGPSAEFPYYLPHEKALCLFTIETAAISEGGRSMKRHLLICGERGVGKSTLIRRLLEHSTREVGGFVTKRLPVADENGFFPIYLYPTSQSEGERCNETANLVGTCDSRSSIRHPEVFDGLGAQLIKSAPSGGIILMDELGFLENDAKVFQSAVLCALDGDTPVLAAVKPKDTPFLRAVRGHENAELVFIDEQNRDALLESSCRTFCGGMKLGAASSPCNREEVFKQTLVRLSKPCYNTAIEKFAEGGTAHGASACGTEPRAARGRHGDGGGMSASSRARAQVRRVRCRTALRILSTSSASCRGTSCA